MTSTVRRAAAGFGVALLVLVVALELSGGAPSAPPPGIPDPGAFVGWGLPATKVLSDFAAVLTIGFLVAAAFLLPSETNSAQGLAVTAVRIASRAAMLWAAASAALYVFTVGDVFALPLADLSPNLVISLVRDSSFGLAIVLQALVALIVAVVARWTISTTHLAMLLGVAIAGLAPVALTGHAAGSGSHDLATTSLLLHLVGVSVWVGGLAALAWVAQRGSKRLEAAVVRYSVLALWCFGIVAVSGAINASVRLGSVGALFTSGYGLLVIGKITAICSLAVFGWRQRRRIMARGTGFLMLATSELFVMAATIGLSVGLSRSPTPVPDNLLETAVEELLGGPIPPPPTFGRLLTEFSGSGVGLTIVLLGTALYLRGVLAMHRRGDAWAVGRTISWLAGMLAVAWATVGGLGEYGHVLFSAHMASHMVLTMVAPILLVLAAPMTLALRTLPGPRNPGETSPRALLMAFLNSRLMRFMTNPIVGPVLFVGSLYGLYFSPLFSFLMESHLGHAAMAVHFLAVGSLFYYVLIGIDPSPRRLVPLVRFGMLLVTIPFHAFFAVSVMSSNRIFGRAYWEFLDRPYRTDLLADQYLGGGIAWAAGEVPLLLVMGALLFQWFRSDAREASRFDRSENRDGDARLGEYNDYLKSLADNGKRRDP